MELNINFNKKIEEAWKDITMIYSKLSDDTKNKIARFLISHKDEYIDDPFGIINKAIDEVVRTNVEQIEKNAENQRQQEQKQKMRQ